MSFICLVSTNLLYKKATATNNKSEHTSSNMQAATFRIGLNRIWSLRMLF